MFYREAAREAFGEEDLQAVRSLVILLDTQVSYSLLKARDHELKSRSGSKLDHVTVTTCYWIFS